MSTLCCRRKAHRAIKLMCSNPVSKLSFHTAPGKTQRAIEFILVHAPHNVLMTALWLNHMKNHFIPATCVRISEFRESKMNVKTLLEKMDVIHEICTKTPYVERTRRIQPSTKSSMQKGCAECREAVLLNSTSKLWASRYHDYMGSQGISANPILRSTDWKPKRHKYIIHIISQMEEHFGQELEAPRGCPYPFQAVAIPGDWSWEACFSLATYRRDRMIDICNGRWQTVDTVETLYLGAVWQALSPEWQDLLALPMVMYARHPLDRVLHTRRMRTQWHSNLKDIQDRDDRLENIFFETCVTKSAKSDVAELKYEKMKQKDILIKMDFGWYLPSSRGGTRVTAAEAPVVEVYESEPDKIEDEGEKLDEAWWRNVEAREDK